MISWLPINNDSDFSIHNLPFGIFSIHGGLKKVGVAISDKVIDLAALADHGLLKEIGGLAKSVLINEYLNDFIALGNSKTNGLRDHLRLMLTLESSPLKELPGALIDMDQVIMHLPVRVGDYTDFYSSIEHATNVGKMFRDPENALLPNWRHIPVGYHGRASSIIETNIPIRRPKGQVLLADSPTPLLTPTDKLDFELEVAFIVGKNSQLGQSVPVNHAEDYIFGLVLFNDWSARDIQKWEYVPLGPFLGKSFASSISPWVVPLEAFDAFRVAGPIQNPPVLDYLKIAGKKNIDLNLKVYIQPQDSKQHLVSNSNFKYMYWNMAQQLAHHTINGCNIKIGDVMASGTISGKDKNSFGSMLELSWNGQEPITLANGTTRSYIEDLDTIIINGFANNEYGRVGFGELRTQVLPAN